MWNSRVKIKHLFTSDESHDAIQTSMNAVADVLKSSPAFRNFNTAKFRNIPQGEDVFRPVDYANRLLESMYDYADENRIWIE